MEGYNKKVIMSYWTICRMKTTKKIYVKVSIIFLLGGILLFSSCEKEENQKIEANRKTLFMYLPWSSNLTNYFYNNISDLEKCITKIGLNNEKVIVFISTGSTEAMMFEIVSSHGRCKREILKKYKSPPFTTIDGITAILNDVKAFAPASVYTMIIGCHGMGWLPVYEMKVRSAPHMKMHWEYQGVPLTRYFGGLTAEYQTDIKSLASGIANAGMKMEYILFDDCYMSSIEVAYELKDVTKYLIGSTSEMMAYGMPYAAIGEYLLGNPDYQSGCEEFYNFYSTYEIMPCGTLAVTDCSELENMAAIIKSINSKYSFDKSLRGTIQRLDGYTPVIFYDFADYITSLCNDPILLNQFREQLNHLVPYKTHTKNFYTMAKGIIPINTFSGITTSDPSDNPMTVLKENTLWYKVAHN